MKQSISRESGMTIFGPRSVTARQGKAILSGNTPGMMYACDKMVPILGKAFMWTEAWTAGYPSHKWMYTSSRKAEYVSLVTPLTSNASSSWNFIYKGYSLSNVSHLLVWRAITSSYVWLLRTEWIVPCDSCKDVRKIVLSSLATNKRQ